MPLRSRAVRGVEDAQPPALEVLGNDPVDLDPHRERLVAGRELLVIGAFAIYLVTVALLTLDDLAIAGNARPHNFVPLRSIGWQLSSAPSPGHMLFQLGGNAVMLSPLGLFLVCVFPRRRFLASLLICASASLVIELLQYALPIGRSADVDDVLLNALGGWAGYAMGLAAFDSLGWQPGFLTKATGPSS